MSACDTYRYELLGCTEYHENCTDNLAACMKELGIEISETPCPINVFMNIPWTDDGGLSYQPPQTKPGDYIQFQALMDCIFAFSACPNDILATNGLDGRIKDTHFSDSLIPPCAGESFNSTIVNQQWIVCFPIPIGALWSICTQLQPRRV